MDSTTIEEIEREERERREREKREREQRESRERERREKERRRERRRRKPSKDDSPVWSQTSNFGFGKNCHQIKWILQPLKR